MSTWQLQDAKARFSEVVATAVKDGPQIITRRGIKTAVVVPIEQWEAMTNIRKAAASQPQLPRVKLTNADFLRLLQSAPDFEIPERHAKRLKRQR